MVVAFSVVPVSMQIDVVMLARYSPSMPGAYVLLTRLVRVNLVIAMAYRAVTSGAIAHRTHRGNANLVSRWAMGLAGLIGLLLVVGWILYPILALWVANSDKEMAAWLALGILWFVAGAPFRVFNACATFALHTLQQVAWVVRWKVGEVGGKVAMNLIFVDFLDAGFAGCFMGSLGIPVISSASVLMRLRLQPGGYPAAAARPLDQRADR